MQIHAPKTIATLDLVAISEMIARYRRERSLTAPESAIRARFVRDSFRRVNLTTRNSLKLLQHETDFQGPVLDAGIQRDVRPETGWLSMRLIYLLAKAALPIVAFGSLGGCVLFMGNPPPPSQWVSFQFFFPDKTKEDAFKRVAEIGSHQSYKMGGTWFIDGQSIGDYFFYRKCAETRACDDEIRRKRVWRQNVPEVHGDQITYRFEIPDQNIYSEVNVGVTITQVRDLFERGTRVRMSIPAGISGKLSPVQRAAAVSLKKYLDERFGADAIRVEYSVGSCSNSSSQPECDFPFWPPSPAGQTQSQTY